MSCFGVATDFRHTSAFSQFGLAVTGSLRMREWLSIVPAASEDYYIVVNHYGRFATAFAETDLL